MKKILLPSGLLTLALLLGLVGFWFWLNAAVTKGFSQGLGAALQAKTTLEEVHLDLFSGKIVADGISLLNLNPLASWNDVQIGHAEASFNLGDVFAKKTPATIEISQVKLHLGAPANQELTLTPEPSATPSPTTPTAGATSWPRIVIEKFALHHGSILGDAQHPCQVGSLEMTAEKTPGTTDWTGNLKCQTLSVYNVKFGVSTAHFQTSDTDIQFDTYQLLLGDGKITGHATIPKDVQQPAQIHYDLDSVPTSDVYPPEWNVLLGGVLHGSGDYQGPVTNWNQGQAKGQLQLHPADLVIPFLNKLSTVPGLNGINHVALDTAKTDYTYAQGGIKLSNLRLEKATTIALTGDLNVTSDGQIDGLLHLGLPSGLVSVVPKLKEEVFPTDAEDYSWADVKVSGTADHLVEDLTPRVAGALGDQGKELIQDAVKKAGDLLNSFMGK